MKNLDELPSFQRKKVENMIQSLGFEPGYEVISITTAPLAKSPSGDVVMVATSPSHSENVRIEVSESTDIFRCTDTPVMDELEMRKIVR